MDFVRDVYLHHHHLVNLGEPNIVVFPLINMTMKTTHIRFVEKLYKNHTLRNRRHNQEIVVVKYSLENTPEDNTTGKNTSSGHVATRTQQLDSLAVEHILRSSSSHDMTLRTSSPPRTWF